MKPKNKSTKNQASKIPTTGRIGRFARILEKETNRDVVEKVMQEVDKYESYKPAEKATWWRAVIERLEKEVSKEELIKIMELCGRKCCGATHRKLAEKCWKESKSIEEFLDNLNKSWAAGVKFKLKDKNAVVWMYERCYCGQVKQTK